MAPDPEQNNSDQDPDEQLVVGSSKLFDGDKLRFIPMPTPDPKDPLNLPTRRKWIAIIVLCFFGSLSLAIESIIGSLLPLFFFEYNGIDPHAVLEFAEMFSADSPRLANVLDEFSSWEVAVPLWRVNLLATLPVVVNGAACLLLVPLSEALGRRPVLLVCGTATWFGGLMAAGSTGFEYHLAARCLQAFGVGAVEALIPLILQDIMFIHQRSKVLATFAASQSVFLVLFGMVCPIIAINLGWRNIYYILSSAACVAWILAILFVPESRRERTPDELAGKEVYPLLEGETRPRLDAASYGPRTRSSNYGLFAIPIRWQNFFNTLKDTIRCAKFPAVVWAVLLCATIAGASIATHQTTAALLLAAGWNFTLVGLAGLPVVVAAPFAWLLSGLVGDWVGNWLAKRRGGRREPETLLLNMIFPCFLVLTGISLYGHVAARIPGISSIILLFSGFLFVWGYTCIFVTLQAFLLESYPNYAGPVLILFSSTKLIIGFALSFKATDWIKAHGFAAVLGMYAGLIGLMALFGVPVYLWGKRLRARSAGTVGCRPKEGGIPLAPLPPPGMAPRDEQAGLAGLGRAAPRVDAPVARRGALDIQRDKRPDTPMPSIAEVFTRAGGFA